MQSASVTMEIVTSGDQGRRSRSQIHLINTHQAARELQLTVPYDRMSAAYISWRVGKDKQPYRQHRKFIELIKFMLVIALLA